MKKVNFVPVIVFLIISALYTLSLADAPQGLTFLTIGVGGKATGMGEAAIAITDDPTAAYWNPAGLASAQTSGAVFMFNRWIQDVSGQFAAGNYRRGHSAIAIHYLGMNVDGIERRTGPSANPTGTFGAHDIAVGLSYARDMGIGLQLGTT